ncbi:MAG: LysM peptidoglycan-binding domain-containing protein [Oligoflexia bacterium]
MSNLAQFGILRRYALLSFLAIAVTGCSMSQTANEEDGIELSGGPEAQSEAQEVAQTDAAPVDSAELVAPAPVEVPPVAEAAPIAEPAPVSEPASVTESPPAAASVGGSSYSVQSGDTLMKIAFDTYGDLFLWRKIYEANASAVADPNRLEVGVVLNLPTIDGRGPSSSEGSEKYLIRRGDTLGSISSKVYGDRTQWKRLWEQNRSSIRDPNQIFAGFYLYYSLTEEDRARMPAAAQ